MLYCRNLSGYHFSQALDLELVNHIGEMSL